LHSQPAMYSRLSRDPASFVTFWFIIGSLRLGHNHSCTCIQVYSGSQQTKNKKHSIISFNRSWKTWLNRIWRVQKFYSSIVQIQSMPCSNEFVLNNWLHWLEYKNSMRPFEQNRSKLFYTNMLGQYFANLFWTKTSVVNQYPDQCGFKKYFYIFFLITESCLGN